MWTSGFFLCIMLTKIALVGATLINTYILALLLRWRIRLRSVYIMISAAIVWVGSICINLWLHSIFIEMIIFASGMMMVAAQYCVARTITRNNVRHARDAPFLLPAILMALATFYDGAIISDVTVTQYGYTIVSSGPLRPIYTCLVALYGAGTILTLLSAHRRTENRSLMRRSYTLLTLIATGALITGILTNAILPGIYNIHTFNAIGPVAVSFLTIGFIAAAIKHRFIPFAIITSPGLLYATFLIAALYIFGFYVALLDAFDADHALAAITMAVTTIAVLISADAIRASVLPHNHIIVHLARHMRAMQRAVHEQRDAPYTLHRIARRILHAMQAENVLIVTRQWGVSVARPQQITIATVATLGAPPMLRTALRRGPSHATTMHHLRTTYAITHAYRIACRGTTCGMLYVISATARTAAHHFFLEQCCDIIATTLAIAHRGHRIARNDVTADLLHRAQTPLTIARSNLEILRRDALRRAHAAERALDALSTSLTDHVHTIVRPPSAARCNISRCIAERCAFFTPYARAHHLTIAQQSPPYVICAITCHDLAIVLDHLLHNAIKYRDAQRRDATIVVRVARKGNAAIITVADRGIGIAPEQTEYIFRRGARGAMHTEGSGIGLAHARSIITRAGGTISAAPRKGGGAVFTIRLPIVRPAKTTFPPHHPQQQIRAES